MQHCALLGVRTRWARGLAQEGEYVTLGQPPPDACGRDGPGVCDAMFEEELVDGGEEWLVVA